MTNNKSPTIDWRKTILIFALFLLVLLFFSEGVEASGNFDVTIPMQLPVYIDSNGIVTTSSTAEIINDSVAPIAVEDISVATLNGWVVEDFDIDFYEVPTDSKLFGMLLNFDEVGIDGTVPLSYSGWFDIAPNSSMPIEYDAKIPAQTSAIANETIAEVVFTVDWKDGVPPTLYTLTFTAGSNGSLQEGSPYILNNVLSGSQANFPTPVPNAGYSFSKWVDVDTDATVSETMSITSDMSIRAEFTLTNPQQQVGNFVINTSTGVIVQYVGPTPIGALTIPTTITVDGIPYPVTEIGSGVFNNMGVTSVTIPEGITSIGANAFSNNSIDAVLIPNSVTFIGSEAFRYNRISKNGKATIDNYPSGITLGLNAFANNHPSGNVDITPDIVWLRTEPVVQGLEPVELVEEPLDMEMLDPIGDMLVGDVIDGSVLFPEIEGELVPTDGLLEPENEKPDVLTPNEEELPVVEELPIDEEEPSMDDETVIDETEDDVIQKPPIIGDEPSTDEELTDEDLIIDEDLSTDEDPIAEDDTGAGVIDEGEPIIADVIGNPPEEETNEPTEDDTVIEDSDNRYTVEFTSGVNGTLQTGSPHLIVNVEEGTAIEFPNPIPDEGYKFLRWEEAETQIEVLEEDLITRDIKIVAIFTEVVERIPDTEEEQETEEPTTEEPQDETPDTTQPVAEGDTEPHEAPTDDVVEDNPVVETEEPISEEPESSTVPETTEEESTEVEATSETAEEEQAPETIEDEPVSETMEQTNEDVVDETIDSVDELINE